MIQKLLNSQSGLYPAHTLSFGRGITSSSLLEQDSDTFELSSNQNKKENRTKLAMICAAVFGVAAICFAIYKHKNPAKSIGSAADNLTNSGGRASSSIGAERTAGQRAERNAAEAADDVAEKAAKEAEENARLEAEKAAKEAEEKARRIEEGRRIYEKYNQQLDGVTHFSFNNKKSEELTEMGKYYHDIELAKASELRQQLANQSENMKWFDSYLQDEPLRKALGIADDAKIMYSRELSEDGKYGRSYILNQKGNILTYDRNKGIWNEWNVKTIEDLLGEDVYKLSQTKQAGGLIITRKCERGGYVCFVRNLETGNDSIARNGIIYKKLPDGTEEELSTLAPTRGEVRQFLNRFFEEAEPTAPKRLPYGEPKEMFVTKQNILKDIEDYVGAFDDGTFQRVNKKVVLYNANGECEVINIIYEGVDYDIDAMGRMLPKLKVDPKVRINTQTVSSDSRNYQRVAQRNKQRQMAYA